MSGGTDVCAEDRLAFDAPVLLVVAKAPVPGLAKTRLAATVGPRAAAELAAASLLDTLAAAAGTGWPVVVALTGDLDRAPGAGELREALAGCAVVDQRGRGLGERLAAAHADAATVSGRRVTIQIGMDTPQVESEDLVAAYGRLAGHDAVVGPACDGGWWLLAARQPALAGCLTRVPMSRSDTGAMTIRALGDAGSRVATTGWLRDVDTAPDADAVAAAAPVTRFARRWAAEPRRRRVAQDRDLVAVGSEILRHSSQILRHSLADTRRPETPRPETPRPDTPRPDTPQPETPPRSRLATGLPS